MFESLFPAASIWSLDFFLFSGCRIPELSFNKAKWWLVTVDLSTISNCPCTLCSNKIKIDLVKTQASVVKVSMVGG